MDNELKPLISNTMSRKAQKEANRILNRFITRRSILSKTSNGLISLYSPIKMGQYKLKHKKVQYIKLVSSMINSYDDNDLYCSIKWDTYGVRIRNLREK